MGERNKMTDSPCVFCRFGVSVSEYDLHGLKFLVSGRNYKPCQTHDAESAARIIELEKEQPKKYILKTGEFVPKTVPVRPNFQDKDDSIREVGQEG
jgi:hypothetical protein